MGYDLTGYKNSTYFRFHIFDFSPILHGAMRYGWVPLGVFPESDDDSIDYYGEKVNEEGRLGKGKITYYLSNDFQLVDKKDCEGLKEALTKALNDDYDFSLRDSHDIDIAKNLEKVGIEINPVETSDKERYTELAKRFVDFIDKEEGFFIL